MKQLIVANIFAILLCTASCTQVHTQGGKSAPTSGQVVVVNGGSAKLTKVLSPQTASWQACIARVKEEYRRPDGKVLDIRIPETSYAIVTVDGKVTPFILYWNERTFELWQLEGLSKHYENASIVMPKRQMITIHGETPGEKNQSASWTLDFSDPATGLKVRFLPDFDIY